MDLLFPERDATDPRLGGKGAALAQLHDAGFAVPAWFAVPPGVQVDQAALDAAVSGLGGDRFAVRSSGAMEDGSGDSFAGQFESHLEVPPREVAARIQAVRLSSQGEGILAYCRERYLPMPSVPTVLVQRMVDARFAGVAFSADPVNGRRDVAVLAAVEGTGEKLVSGAAEGETWALRRDGSVQMKPEGPLLSEKEARDVVALAIACERHFGRPQDIEWAIDQRGQLWLLQSRPITTLATFPDPDDPLRVWDNSNIAESYGGVTTPLTFSFARRIYEHVYREFCKLMSVPRERIERADDVFPQMLGLIRGRTYYNLASWYRVLALLPGFQVNRSFMEQMMGVREPLPASLVETIVAESRTGKWSDLFALIRTCVGLVQRWSGLERRIDRFMKRLDRALAPTDLEALPGDALVGHYRDLERQLLKKWDAPLVNDFFAMIFYGVLRGLCKKWAGDGDGTLQNDLLADTGGVISAEPAKRILEMARMAAALPGLPSLLADRSVSQRDKRKALKESPSLDAAFEEYLDRFGDRCLEELKLESPTVKDDASALLCSIGILAGNPRPESGGTAARRSAPRFGNPLKAFVFARVVSQARARIRWRENLRFERTRLFGRVRGIFKELGKRLHADGRLSHPDDVFYLELGEVFDAWDGTETTADLAALSVQRRLEFEEYQRSEAPPDRFETHGPVHRYERWDSPSGETEPVSGAAIQGIGACPGVVRARVRVVLDPREAIMEQGEILVARQTDPGWVILFPSASGLLVERGSLLSHSAIVSRELGLPCIVSLPGITRILKTGDLVEMNGSTGTIRILE